MKLLIVISMLASTVAFATETKTECPWMKEMNKRNNPKAELASQSAKIKMDLKPTTTTGQ